MTKERDVLVDLGVSTSCLYPMETEKALETVARLGIKNVEVHFSTFSELTNSYLKEIGKILKYYGVVVYSVHPFYCMMESPMFFSEYNERRFSDGMEIYKQYFHAAAKMGAKYLVFHGGQLSGASRCTVSDDEYIERYNILYECGKKFGVTLLHENVKGHKCGDIEFCSKMIKSLGDKALFTFDSKQARRAGYDSMEFARALNGHIRNIHISDYTDECDCVLLGKGKEDFSALKEAIGADAEAASWMIEVYNSVFDTPWELEKAVDYLKLRLQ